MKLDEIKTGSEVFVDSNIFIYHFIAKCKEETGRSGAHRANRLKSMGTMK
jgi:hypothetical protein